MITLKLSYQEITTLGFITWNDAALLMRTQNNLYRLAGLIIHDLHHRLNSKVEFTFNGKKTVKLNEKECFALRQFLLQLAVFDNDGEIMLRREIFQTIDKKLL